MTKRIVRFSIGTAGLVLLVLLTTLVQPGFNLGRAKAQSEDACTLETVAGTYLFHGEGTTVSEGEVLAYAEAGVWTLDGSGHATGVMSASMDGEAFTTREPLTATYEHAGGCVYAVVDEFGFEVDLYTTPAGTPMTYFAPGFSGVQLRQ